MPPPAASPGSLRAPLNTTATLAALVIGLGLGLGASVFGSDELAGLAEALAPAGGAWVAALRMLVVPLVVCLLIAGLGGAAGRALGRLGATALAVFAGILATGGAVSVTLGPAMIEWLRVPRGVLLGAATVESAPRAVAPPAGEWLSALSGGGFAQALARGDLLPVVVVTLVFGLALTRVDEAPRRRLLELVQAVQAVLFVVLSWILALAPAAVFCLAFAMAARRGLAAAHVVGSFVLGVVVLLLLFWVALYPAAALLGRVPLRRFARAALPAQAVAVGTRSSLAALPALLDSGARLGLPGGVNAFVMPLAVSVFKANRTLSGPFKMLFLAHVYGIELTALGIAAYVAMEVLLSVGTPGTPQGGAYPTTAVLLAMGVPMEGIALLHALYALPDVFMTLTNVTADLAAAAIVARATRGSLPAGEPALEAAPA